MKGSQDLQIVDSLGLLLTQGDWGRVRVFSTLLLIGVREKIFDLLHNNYHCLLWCPIKMRVFHQNESCLPCPHPPSSYGGRMGARRQLSFLGKTLILIGHYGIRLLAALQHGHREGGILLLFFWGHLGLFQLWKPTSKTSAFYCNCLQISKFFKQL